MKKLFKTQKEIDTAIGNFKQLKGMAGWQLLKQIVDENVRVLEQQILNGIEGATQEQMDRRRDKLKAYRDVINTPDNMIRKLESPEHYEEEIDPYHTTESLQEEKKKARQDTK